MGTAYKRFTNRTVIVDVPDPELVGIHLQLDAYNKPLFQELQRIIRNGSPYAFCHTYPNANRNKPDHADIWLIPLDRIRDVTTSLTMVFHRERFLPINISPSAKAKVQEFEAAQQEAFDLWA